MHGDWYLAKFGTLFHYEPNPPSKRITVEFLHLTTNDFTEHQYQPPFGFEYCSALPLDAPKNGVVLGHLDPGEYRIIYDENTEFVAFHNAEIVHSYVRAFRVVDEKMFCPDTMASGEGQSVVFQ